MNTPLAIAMFIVIWWTVIFAVLPFGIRSQSESGEVTAGTDPGAPIAPRLWRKAFWTTLITLLVWGALLLAIQFFNY